MLDWTQHPALPIPSQDEMLAMGPERLLEFYEKREQAIVRETEDPYRFGFELDCWQRADEQLATHQEIRHLIPVDKLTAKSVSLSPLNDSSVGKYEPFRDAWCVFA